MILFPNCKINLGLHITQKRPDGFHNLQTFFYPVPITDALEIVTQEHNKPFEFTLSGPPLDATSDNICVKAYELLKKDFPQLPPIKMHLHKSIPVGAGLGGGSADGAFTLRLLNTKYNLQLSKEQLLQYALQLGSDCPFFILNQSCLATGRGELLSPQPLDLSAYKLVLVNPGIHIHTGWAFSQLQPEEPAQPLSEVIKQPVETWKANLTNDFEAPIFRQHPPIAQIKQDLYAAGAVYASMSGSGSTVFALFDKDAHPQFHFAEHYFVKECYLSTK